MKVIVLGATFSTGNMGVNALASGVIDCILNAWKNPEITILDYGKGEDDIRVNAGNTDLVVRSVKMRFSIKIVQSNNILVLIALAFLCRFLPGTIKSRITEKNRVLHAICSSGVVLSIAGGDSFADIYGIERALYVMLPQLLVLLLGKDLVQMPQTYGPFNKFAGKMLASFILRRSKKVFSRDWEGVEYAKGILGKKRSDKIAFSYDVGFLLSPRIPGRLENTVSGVVGELIGINVSGLLYIRENSSAFGLKVDYKEMVDRLIAFFIEEKSCTVMLVPHVFGGVENVESDTNACTVIYKELEKKYGNKIRFCDTATDHHEIKYFIGKCDLFLGSRMHACIAALSQCIPAIGIAYSCKFLGVYQSIGMEELVADPTQHDLESIMKKIDCIYNDRNLFRKQLTSIMPGIKEKAVGILNGEVT